MHPAWTYMLRDIAGSFWGAVVFGCALLAPGFVAGHATDVCGFRTQRALAKTAWSIALSFGVGTLLAVAGVWLGGPAGGAVLLAVLGICGVALLFRTKEKIRGEWREYRKFAVLAIAICIVTTGSLVDLGIGTRLYMSVTAYDNALRTAFVEAVLRTGVPPASPVYWPGHDAPMHYYYYWYVVCASVAKLAHISARQALIASSAWSVVGVMAALALFGRYILKWRGDQLEKRWWTAIGLLAVTGFDGIIALLYFLHTGTVARDIEWWSLDQVTSWADTFLWVPHHAAALVCSVLCLVLLRVSTEGTERRQARTTPVLAGLAFASAFGLSTYVALGLLLIQGLVLARQLLSGYIRRSVVANLTAGVTAAIFLAPYVAQLMKPQPGARHSASHVLALGLRELFTPAVLLGAPGLSSLHVTHPGLATEISDALLLIPGYITELGFFAFALVLLHRKNDKSDEERFLLFMTWSGLLVVSVIRSQVIAMNDYAVRASLLPQFFLLLVGVYILESARSLPRLFLLGALVIGVTTSMYQVVQLRIYLPVHENEGMQAYAGLGHQNYALRDAYSEFVHVSPMNARIQFSVPNANYTGFAQLQNVGRQVIVEDNHCNDSFGGEVTPCESIQTNVEELFSATHTARAAEAASLCRAIGSQYLSVAKWDPAWKQISGWAWTLPAVVVRPDVRVLACSTPNK